MALQIAIRIPEADLAELDRAIAEGRYESRAAGMRAALQLLLRAERNELIAESYRAAYASHPPEEGIGEAGAALAGELLRERGPTGTD